MNMQSPITSPNLLVSVLDALDALTILVDVGGFVTLMNDACRKRLPDGGIDHIGHPFSDLCHAGVGAQRRKSQRMIQLGPYPTTGVPQPLFNSDGTLIDRALIAPITKSKSQRKIVATIVEIAKLSNAEVIAKGIGTEEHARIATAIGCDILQGYGLAHPMDARALQTLLTVQGN